MLQGFARLNGFVQPEPLPDALSMNPTHMNLKPEIKCRKLEHGVRLLIAGMAHTLSAGHQDGNSLDSAFYCKPLTEFNSSSALSNQARTELFFPCRIGGKF